MMPKFSSNRSALASLVVSFGTAMVITLVEGVVLSEGVAEGVVGASDFPAVVLLPQEASNAAEERMQTRARMMESVFFMIFLLIKFYCMYEFVRLRLCAAIVFQSVKDRPSHSELPMSG